MEPTKFQLDLYKKLSPILGITPKVTRYGDDNSVSEIRILSCPDPIDDNVIIYSTIGLSEIKNNSNSKEIFFTSYKSFEKAPNILSTAAFFMINDKWEATLGVVFESLITMYYPDEAMKHVFFTSPYLWEDKLEDFEVNSKAVDFLLAIPISENELKFKNENGYERLEDLLQENEIDIYDIKRKSIV